MGPAILLSDFGRVQKLTFSMLSYFSYLLYAILLMEIIYSIVCSLACTCKLAWQHHVLRWLLVDAFAKKQLAVVQKKEEIQGDNLCFTKFVGVACDR